MMVLLMLVVVPEQMVDAVVSVTVAVGVQAVKRISSSARSFPQ